MKIRLLLYTSILIGLSNVNQVYGQDESKRTKYIGLEIGSNSIYGENKNLDHVRQRNSYSGYYYDDHHGYGTNPALYNFYFGINLEQKTSNEKFGYSVGLRYSILDSYFDGNNYSYSSDDYFYFVFSQNEETTEYLRIKSLEETPHYIGIPLELKYYPLEFRGFSLYAKLGVDFNLRINNKRDVVFHDDAMEIHQDEVLQIVGDISPFYSSFYFGTGVKYDIQSKLLIGLDFNIPYVLLTSDVSSLVNGYSGLGAQFNLQIPF